LGRRGGGGEEKPRRGVKRGGEGGTYEEQLAHGYIFKKICKNHHWRKSGSMAQRLNSLEIEEESKTPTMTGPKPEDETKELNQALGTNTVRAAVREGGGAPAKLNT